MQILPVESIRDIPDSSQFGTKTVHQGLKWVGVRLGLRLSNSFLLTLFVLLVN